MSFLKKILEKLGKKNRVNQTSLINEINEQKKQLNYLINNYTQIRTQKKIIEIEISKLNKMINLFIKDSNNNDYETINDYKYSLEQLYENHKNLSNTEGIIIKSLNEMKFNLDKLKIINNSLSKVKKLNRVKESKVYKEFKYNSKFFINKYDEELKYETEKLKILDEMINLGVDEDE